MALKTFLTILTQTILIASSLAQTCTRLKIPVTATGTNKQIPPNSTLSVDLVRQAPSFPDITITKNVTIAATYCEPTIHFPSRHHTLQVLVHGATYNRTYWSSLDLPLDEYNWVKYASDRGYPTLAIDRLCNGNSTLLDGYSECQHPLEAAATHAVILRAKAGTLFTDTLDPYQEPAHHHHPHAQTPLPLPRPFHKIIYTGHSLGSIQTNYFAHRYPSSADALIFTGWSSTTLNAIPIITNYTNPQRARDVDPEKYSYLPANDPYYLTFDTAPGYEYALYHGDFNHTVEQYNYAIRGTATFGEFATVLLGQLSSPKYRGAVFVLDGKQDNIFCQTSMESAKAGALGNCEAGGVTGAKGFYPNARAFGYQITGDTGHCLNLHRTALESYAATFAFLEEQGF